MPPLQQSGRLFSEIGELFSDPAALMGGGEDLAAIRRKIADASAELERIASLEEAAHASLLAQAR